MQEVLDELLKAEAEAQKVIARAQEEAQAIKTQVEADYSLKLGEAREAARRAILTAVEKTREAAKREGEAALKKAQAATDALWEEKRSVIDGLTDEVIALVLTPEYEKE